jgi:hypothetical protein
VVVGSNIYFQRSRTEWSLQQLVNMLTNQNARIHWSHTRSRSASPSHH